MKNKLLLMAFILLLVLPTALWSQYQVQSLESQTSFGLFKNPLDAAFNVSDYGPQPTFTNLDMNYLFGGLANFPLLPSAFTFSDVPLLVGYHHGGTMPWSALSDILVDTERSSREMGISPTYLNKVVGTTTHRWTSVEADSEYDFLQAWDTSIGGAFLIGLGVVNTGLFLSWDNEQNAGGLAIDTWVDANRELKETFYYDTAGAGVAPAPALNYTQETTTSFPDTEMSITAVIPVYVPLGAMGLDVTLATTYYSRDQSGSSVESFTSPMQVGAGSFNAVSDDSLTDKTGFVSFDLDGILSMGPLRGDHPDNRFDVGLNGGARFNWADTYEGVIIDQDYDYAGGGAPLVIANNGTTSYQSTTIEREGNLEYDVSVFAQHYCYFNLGESVVFGMAPKAEIGVAYSIFDTYDTEETDIQKIDNSGDGDYNDVADRIITDTTTYRNNDDGGNFDINGTASLPTAIKFHPPSSILGFTVGNELGVGCTVRSVKDNTNTQENTVVTVDGTGAPVSSTNTTEGDSYEQRSTTTIWSFSSNFEFALNFYLSENAIVDVVLYPFDFALYIQGIFALP